MRHGGVWCTVLFAMILVLTPVQAKIAGMATGDLKDYAEKAEGRSALGLYLFGNKIGWMVFESRIQFREGREVAVEHMEMAMSMESLGTRNEVLMKETTVYSLDGDGEILAVDSTEDEDGYVTRIRVRQVEDGLEVHRHSPAGDLTRLVPTSRATLGHSMRLDRWLESEPAVGESMVVWEVDFTAEKVDDQARMIYQGRKSIAWGGRPVVVHHVQTVSDGLTFDGYLLNTERLLSGHIMEIIEVRDEDPATVKRMDRTAVDLFDLTSVTVDRDLGPVDTLQRVELEVSGLGDYRIPTSHRQEVHDETGGRARVIIHRDFLLDAAEPLSEQERQQYLAATPSYEIDHESIREVAASLATDAQDPLTRARLVQQWIWENLHFSLAANTSSALAVLHQRCGDCSEYSTLYVALARACGLPAREVSGLVYIGEGANLFGWHAWVEIHDGRQWVSVDPSWDEILVGPTRLKFFVEDGDESQSILKIMTRLDIRVLDLEHAP